jgi:spore coat protein U-like protein
LAFFCPASYADVTCTVTATGVVFGVYDPTIGTPTNANGTVTTTCTLSNQPNAQNVSLTLSYSPGFSTVFSNRTMHSGANLLPYNLYINTGYKIVAGDGTGGTSTETDGFKLNGGHDVRSATDTIYGQILPGQDVVPGSYLDSIVVTVSY